MPGPINVEPNRYPMPNPVPRDETRVATTVAGPFTGTVELLTLSAFMQNTVSQRTNAPGGLGEGWARPGDAFHTELAALGRDYVAAFPGVGNPADVAAQAARWSAIDAQYWEQYAAWQWDRFERGSGETPPNLPKPSWYEPPKVIFSGPGHSPTGGPVVNSEYTPDGRIVGSKSTTTTSLVVLGAPVWNAGSAAAQLPLVDGYLHTDSYDIKWIAEWHPAGVGGGWFWRKG